MSDLTTNPLCTPSSSQPSAWADIAMPAFGMALGGAGFIVAAANGAYLAGVGGATVITLSLQIWKSIRLRRLERVVEAKRKNVDGGDAR